MEREEPSEDPGLARGHKGLVDSREGGSEGQVCHSHGEGKVTKVIKKRYRGKGKIKRR